MSESIFPTDPGTSPANWLDRSKPNALNAVRLLLAWAVIVSHAYHLRGEPEILQRLIGCKESLGYLAVNAFFIISGFLVTGSWCSGRGAEQYLRNRILRIWPGFVVAVVVSVLIATVIPRGGGITYLKSLPKIQGFWDALNLDAMFLTTPAGFPGNPFPGAVNGSLWTIPVEFGCYLFVAFFGALDLLQRRRSLLAIIGFGLLVFWMPRLLGSNSEHLWARFVATFGAGACVWLFREKIPNHGLMALGCAGALSLGVAFPPVLPLFFPIFGTYLIFWAAFNAPAWIRAIGSKNDISYGVYLYAFPIQQVIYSVRLAGGTVSPAINIGVTSLLVTGFAWASWLLVERPALRLGRGRPHRPTNRVAPN